MGAALVPLTIASGLFGAYGQYQQGKAQAAMYNNQAVIAENNAKLAEAQASETLKRGAREEQRFRQQARQAAATQESQLAASGATLGGSAGDAIMDTTRGIERDVTDLRYNVLQERYGQKVQAVNFRNEASSARAAAGNAKKAGMIGAFGSLLGMGVGIAGAAGNNTKASYTPNGGINVESRYGNYYHNNPTSFGSWTDKNVPNNWWEMGAGGGKASWAY